MNDFSPLPDIGRVVDAAARRQLLREMLRIRLAEEAIVARYGEGAMRCPVHICIGQEAPPVGVSAHLRREDLVFSAHRSHGHFLAKGGDLKAMIAEMYGRATGCALGKGGSQHLIDLEAGFMGSAPILASTISVGVGAAWGAVMQDLSHVVVIYFGDGATEEGTFHEAMNFAGTRRLPVVFVCENNLYSVHTALDVRQPAGRSISTLAAAHGMEGLRGDGNDVDAVWRLGGYAVDKARRGDGPVLLELMTYRWKEHVGPNEDSNLGYRSPDEVAAWAARCPIARYERRLAGDGVTDATAIAAMRAEIGTEIAAAFEFALRSPFPAAEALGEHVYPPATL